MTNQRRAQNKYSVRRGHKGNCLGQAGNYCAVCVQPVDAVCSRDRHGKLFFRGRAVPTLKLVSLLRAGSRSTPILVFLATPVPVYTSHLLTYTRFSPPHPPPSRRVTPDIRQNAG